MGNTESYQVKIINTSITNPSDVIDLDPTFWGKLQGTSVPIPMIQTNVAHFDLQNVVGYDDFFEDCVYRRLQAVCSVNQILVPTAKEMVDFDWKSFKRTRRSNPRESRSNDTSSPQAPSEKDSEGMPPLEEEESNEEKGEEMITEPPNADEKANADSNEKANANSNANSNVYIEKDDDDDDDDDDDEKGDEAKKESDDRSDRSEKNEKWIVHGFVIQKCLFPTQLDRSLRIFGDAVQDLVCGTGILREQDAFRWRIRKEKTSQSSSSLPNYKILLFLKSPIPFCKGCGKYHA